MDNEKVSHMEALEKLPYLEEKLAYVAKQCQIGIEFIDVDCIFAAYLDLRDQVFDFRRLESEHWNEAYKGAREYFLATQGDYFVSYEELSKMTLKEVCEKLD